MNADAPKLVNEIRTAEAPFEIMVGGYPADLTDFREKLLERIPAALLLVFVITFVILFLMTGSILLPVKATVLNFLSLTIMFGALVWVFQDGNLSGLLNFTPAGSIEPSIPILMFCIAYGLSMDYEVFILSRIKEEYDRTGDLTESVASGIQKSGSLVTAAAAILAFTFAAYSMGEVVFLKMLGVGMTLAVLVDATLIRSVLVPAFMKLAGRANWWAPPALRRFHERYGISEGGPATAIREREETQPKAIVN
jgi:RND superfamily putative drug exporter